MSVFGDYSNYYDLLYADKNYAGESEYVHNLIKANLPKAKTILNLGCGTGKHDLLLSKHDYKITGVDFSEDMIKVAQQQSELQKNNSVEFLKGDARTVRLDKKFDVVITLFHVMSYQTTNADIDAVFVTAKEHLRDGGLLIFDCWYGPAVLSEQPSVRIKRLEDNKVKITRIAEPVMHINQNIVDVNYELFIEDIQSEKVNKLAEKHSMRYLFLPEILSFTERNGFKLILSEEWMTKNKLSDKSWSACFCSLKV